MDLTRDELELCRQWFHAVQDVTPEYLKPDDYRLAVKLYTELGLRAPHSVSKPSQLV